MINSIIDQASKELAKDLALVDGELLISDARKDDKELPYFLSFARRMGVTQYRYVPAAEFVRRYGGVNPGKVMENMSDVQGYAVRLLNDAYKKGATDVHIAYYGAYGTIKFRVLGLVQDHAKLPGELVKALIGSIYNTLCKSTNTITFTPKQRQDARIVEPGFLPPGVHSVRVHSEPLESAQAESGAGAFMALRLLYDRTEAKGGLDERLAVLGYDKTDIEKFYQLTERTGLTVIAGPTGHGKSTLLMHLMNALAILYPYKNRMSIEDPPEYPLDGTHQIMVDTNFDANADPAKRASEYTNAIAGAMRSDPDTLMIGEIRYAEAAKAAIESALTGHATFATLHANHALGIIMRMQSLLSGIGGYSDPLEYLCNPNVLAGLIYQRLLPVLCPNCKIPLAPLLLGAGEKDREHMDTVLPKHTRERLMRVADNLESVHILGRGCEECGQLGIVGQTVAAEVIVTDETFLRHIRHGNQDKAHEYWLANMKGRTHVQHAIEGIVQGRLDPYLSELRLGVPLDFSSGNNAGEKS